MATLIGFRLPQELQQALVQYIPKELRAIYRSIPEIDRWVAQHDRDYSRQIAANYAVSHGYPSVLQYIAEDTTFPLNIYEVKVFLESDNLAIIDWLVQTFYFLPIAPRNIRIRDNILSYTANSVLVRYCLGKNIPIDVDMVLCKSITQNNLELVRWAHTQGAIISDYWKEPMRALSPEMQKLVEELSAKN